MQWFSFNNRTSDEFDLIINKYPGIVSPNRRTEKMEVIGRHGHLTHDYGSYESFTLDFELTLMNSSIEMIREITRWLTGGGKLTLSRDPDKYYLARIKNAIPFEQVFTNGFKTFKLTFECQPFAYEYAVSTIKCDSGITRVYNHTNVESLPILKVIGDGVKVIKVNGLEVTLTLDGYMTLNCELEVAHKDGANRNDKMIGGFPSFNIGFNEIELPDGVTCEITPNWKWV